METAKGRDSKHIKGVTGQVTSSLTLLHLPTDRWTTACLDPFPVLRQRVGKQHFSAMWVKNKEKTEGQRTAKQQGNWP